MKNPDINAKEILSNFAKLYEEQVQANGIFIKLVGNSCLTGQANAVIFIRLIGIIMYWTYST